MTRIAAGGRRAAGLVVVAVVVVGAAGLGGPARGEPERRARRAGKVVRVERPRLLRRTEMRLCPMPFTDQNKGTCYGGAPEVGDRGALFDFDRRYLGEIRVEAVMPSQSGPCPAGLVFDFTYKMVATAPGAPDVQVPFAIAVFGMDIDPLEAELVTDAGELPKPSLMGRGQPWMGVDRDGRDGVDMVVTAFECSDTAPLPPNPGHKTAEAFCLDYWVGSAGRWRRVRRDHLYSCL